MAIRLKPIHEQVIVITGATSGIGLVTARMAAKKGARLVLAARDRDALTAITEEIRAKGGEAAFAVADVADETAMRGVAETAERHFGGFDTWVNNAGVSIYGRLEDVPPQDHRRLFETNYTGTVIGSLIAARRLRQRGGTIINIGSVLSDRALPLQGAYSASKHAVKGFTEALRMELEADHAPVSVTLIKPGTIDTLFEEHAKNLLSHEPVNPPPAYAPELVAEAILHAASHPVRDLYVGGGGRMIALAGRLMPRTTDYLMERYMARVERRGPPREREDDSLHHPFDDGRERLGRHRMVRRRSLYTTAELHPWTTAAAVAGLGALAYWAMGGRRGRGWGRPESRMRAAPQARPDAVTEIGHRAKPASAAATEGEVVFPR